MTTEEQQNAADNEEAPAPARQRTTRRRTTAAKSEAKPAKPRSTGKRAGAKAGASGSGAARPARRRRAARPTAEEDAPRPAARLPRLLERLRTDVGPSMVREFGYTSPMQVPRLDKIVLNIERFGNTTAATIPLALDDAITDGRLKKGDRVLLTSVGAGFTIGAVLLRWAF